MRNKFFNRFVAAVSIAACSLCLVAGPNLTMPVAAAVPSGEETVSPAAEILEWVYMELEGKRYKRLFNCTTQQWVGDWIYLGEA